MLRGLNNAPTGFCNDNAAGLPGGGEVTAGSSLAPIANESHPCVAVILQAPITNTGAVKVGNASVSCRCLEPGDIRLIRINDAAKVHVQRAASPDQTVRWGVITE